MESTLKDKEAEAQRGELVCPRSHRLVELGGNRAENRNPGVQLGLMSIFQGDVILFSEPRTVDYIGQIKENSPVFTFWFLTSISANCITVFV